MSKMNSIKTWLKPKSIVIFAFAILNLFFFQNCSQRGNIEMMVNQKNLLSLMSSSIITINNDDPYTRDVNVGLQISASNADEMYLTEVADCSSGGMWEPLSNERSWVLKQENQNAFVFVKFRSNIDAGVESECISDSILHDSIAPQVRSLSGLKIYSNQHKINLAVVAEDEGSGLDEILCTLPESQGQQTCQQNITLQVAQDGVHSVQVAATDKAGNQSEKIIIQVIADTQAPELAIHSAPALVSGETNAHFVFSANDNLGEAQIHCKVDEMNLVECPADYTIKVGPGDHVLTVVARDAAGNTSEELRYQWNVDVKAPIVGFTRTPAPYSNLVRPNFEFSGSDEGVAITNFECKIDEGAYAKCSSPLQTATLGDGSHIIYLRGLDQSGNLSATMTYSWVIDTKLPILTLIEKPAPIEGTNVARFAMAVQDDNPGKIMCSNNLVEFSECVSPLSFLVMGQEQSMRMYALDKAGNKSTVLQYNWKVDVVGPLITLVKNPTSTLSYLKTADFEFTVRDELSEVRSVKCGLDNNLVDCSASMVKSFAGLSLGSHSFMVKAEDALGNIGSLSYTFNVVDDTRAITQTFTITPSTVQKADILIVIDNSKSMGTEQSNMAARFAKFLEVIGGLDWRVGIITTDVSAEESLKNGRLIEFTGMAGKYFIDSKMNLSEATTAFQNTIQRSEQGSSNEQGIAATHKAISRALNASSDINLRNAEFFRLDAALAVIVVSDADETPKDGVVGTINIPENLIDLVSRTWSNKPFQWHSIVVPNGDLQCRDLIKGYKSDGQPDYENEDYGIAYERLSSLTGGVKGTVCATDYSGQLTSIGQGVVNLVSKVNLQCQPLDTTGDGKPDIKITLADGSQAPSYTLMSMGLTFSAPLPVGTHSLEYKCLGN